MTVATRTSHGKQALRVLIAGLVLAAPASAQEDRMWRPPEATIYRDAGYKGPAVFVNEAKPDMGLAWQLDPHRIGFVGALREDPLSRPVPDLQRR